MSIAIDQWITETFWGDRLKILAVSNYEQKYSRLAEEQPSSTPPLFATGRKGDWQSSPFYANTMLAAAIVAIFWQAVTDHFSKWTVDMMNVDYCSERAVERESGSRRHTI
ncbi:hypothetical protein TNCV_1085961 [Trichonephila clavipes]|nr:hypothetical protein TNCV_1085961 [Trichonephila clavipes]